MQFDRLFAFSLWFARAGVACEKTRHGSPIKADRLDGAKIQHADETG
jgi:hypothetical protein